MGLPAVWCSRVRFLASSLGLTGNKQKLLVVGALVGLAKAGRRSDARVYCSALLCPL